MFGSLASRKGMGAHFHL